MLVVEEVMSIITQEVHDMEVKFRINARDFKKDVQELLNMKIRGITANTELYDTISNILVDYIRDYLPVDTGALRDQAAGESERSGYFREGYLEVSKSHGIVWDAIEHRPKEFKHYAGYVIGRVLGMQAGWNGEDLKDAMIANGDWESFIEDCEPYLIEAFNKEG